MKKFEKKQLQEYANSLCFNLNNNELESLDKEINDVLSSLEKIRNINTDNIEPMNYPHDNFFTQLREDVAVDVADPKDYLNNVNEIEEGFVVINYDK